MPIYAKSKIACKLCSQVKLIEDFPEMGNPTAPRYMICNGCISLQERKAARSALETLYDGPKIHQLTLETFRQLEGKEKGREAVKTYAGGNLYLWGESGTGKSHLAGALMNEWINSHTIKTLRYETPNRLNRKMRKLDPEEEQTRLDDYINAEIMVLDDLGHKKDSEFSQSIVYEILDGRDKKLKRGCVVTSNLSLDDLGKLYEDDRIPSRLSSFKIVYVGGADMRGKGAM
jgi:DNA replication protein DnaC